MRNGEIASQPATHFIVHRCKEKEKKREPSFRFAFFVCLIVCLTLAVETVRMLEAEHFFSIIIEEIQSPQ